MRRPDGHHLAQINVALALDDLDSPRLADFVAALERVNAVAERSPGFVWRLKDEVGGDATSIKVSDDPRFIINMSVWETAEDLEHFVWNTVHKRVYAKKASWFATESAAHLALWWVPAGRRPTAEEGMARLAALQQKGPDEDAFGWESLPNFRLWMSQRCA